MVGGDKGWVCGAGGVVEGKRGLAYGNGQMGKVEGFFLKGGWGGGVRGGVVSMGRSEGRARVHGLGESGGGGGGGREGQSNTTVREKCKATRLYEHTQPKDVYFWSVIATLSGE